MIGTVKVISTSFDKFKRLVVKVLFRGKIINGIGDIRTPIEASSFGIDSNPTAKKVAIYAESGVIGKYYIIGYLNTNRLADVGETRIFATDKDGVLKGYTWLKNNGTLELMGNTNWAVKFNELKTAFDELQSKFNTHVSTYNTHTHPYINVLVPANTSASAAVSTPSIADIDNAKNTKIKTNS